MMLLAQDPMREGKNVPYMSVEGEAEVADLTLW